MIKWIVLNTACLLLITKVIPGFQIDNWKAAILAACIIGCVNAVIKPLFILVTLPITVITLGLFSLFINTCMLLLASAITPGFKISGFITAFIASLLYSVLLYIGNSILSNKQ